MKTIGFALAFILCIGGCSTIQESYTFADGTYKGSFKREITRQPTDTSTVILRFSGNTWSGSSSKPYYPALCKGTYSIVGDTIIFMNECAWTANFDGTLILGGKYKIRIQSDSIEISKDFRSATSDKQVDRYRLKRQ
jgi:hypothetical protein